MNYETCLERSPGVISSYGAIINFTPSGELWNLSEEISPVVIASYGAIKQSQKCLRTDIRLCG